MAVHEQGELVTSRRGFFWVGVERASVEAGTVPRGPMYVQWEAPAEVRRPYPVVMIHGGGGQGLDWLGTPDGRPGWAGYLVEEGYAVYVVDRPGHGRSSYHPDVLGPMRAPFTYELARFLFMPPGEGTAPNPAAHLHTQWPGDGSLGDPALDQFLAASGPMIRDFAAAHALEGARGAELLDRIGPAVLIANSAGGPAAWVTADARPGLVKAIVAVEVMGPPFLENPDLGVSLDWGVAAAPLAYDPPVSDPSELRREEPAHRLANLQGIPIAVVTGEASFLGQSDAATAAFLARCGCDALHLRLADHGVHGNGHLMMLERNNREALQPILDWLGASGL
jgi:pimeloyl-ACP methyl ester carboxylesterase